MSYIHHFRKINVAIREFKPDVILSFTPISNLFVYILSRFYDFAWFPNISGRGRFLNGNFGDILFKVIFKSATKIFTQNSTEDNFIRGLGFSTSLLPGSGVKLIDNIDRAKAPEFTVPIRFVYVGRFVPSKGLPLALDAFEQLTKLTEREIELHIYGGIQHGGSYSLYKRVIDEAKSNKIFYHGWCENIIEELGGKYHYMIFLSQYGEGTPRCLIEAGGLGIVSITLRKPGSEDIIIDKFNGLVLENAHLGTVVNSLQEACNCTPEEFSEMSSNAIQHVEQHYDVSIVNEIIMTELKRHEHEIQ